MEKDDCFYFGKVIKTHGIKGGISIRIDADNPADYKEIDMLLIEINKSLIPYFITEKSFHSNKAYLKLVDVDSVEKAAELAGNNIFSPPRTASQAKRQSILFSRSGRIQGCRPCSWRAGED